MSRFDKARIATAPAPLPVAADAGPQFTVPSLEAALLAAAAFYRHGLGNGDTTHWACLDDFWTWLKKEITIITGNPNHGKSRFILAVMLIKAALSKWRFAVYVPENEEDFFVETAQMLVGRTANLKAGHDRMSLEQLEEAIAWLHEHFVLVSAPDGCTPKQLLAEFARLHAEKPLDGVLIDPWNQLSHDFQSREDLYLSEQFSMLKRFAIKENLSVLVTAHPAGQAKDKNGNLVRPDAYNISGGKMWNNKFDNVMAVFRPSFPEPDTELWIHKIKKQGRVGQPGMLALTYQRPLFRYFPKVGDDSHPLDKVSFNAPGAPAWSAHNPHQGLTPAPDDAYQPRRF